MLLYVRIFPLPGHHRIALLVIKKKKYILIDKVYIFQKCTHFWLRKTVKRLYNMTVLCLKDGFVPGSPGSCCGVSGWSSTLPTHNSLNVGDQEIQIRRPKSPQKFEGFLFVCFFTNLKIKCY